MFKNTDDTLFLITYCGERHEDHIPEQVCSLGFIKQFVSKKTYQELLGATGWVMEKNWIDDSDVSKGYLEGSSPIKAWESKVVFERFRNNEETEDDWEMWQDVILNKNFFPIRLNDNKCCRVFRT